MIFFLMSINFSNIERNRNCIFGRRKNWDNLSQGQSDINAFKAIVFRKKGNSRGY